MSANEEVEVKIVEEVFVDGELAELVIVEEFAKRGEKRLHVEQSTLSKRISNWRPWPTSGFLSANETANLSS